MSAGRQVIVLPDAQAVTEEAARRVLELALKAIHDQGQFSIALSGGSTPRALFQRLAQHPYAQDMPWAQTLVFWGDERTVPPDSPDSNYRMAYEALLSRVPIPANNIHRMAGEAADLQAAADEYAAELKQAFALGEGGWPRFDLILLGMGDDGHTASLFPGTEALGEQRKMVVVNDVPQLKTRRLTFTFPVLNHAGYVLFLVTGAGKAGRVAQVLSGGDFPSAKVQPVDGQLVWMLDRAAAAKIQK